MDDVRREGEPSSEVGPLAAQGHTEACQLPAESPEVRGCPAPEAWSVVAWRMCRWLALCASRAPGVLENRGLGLSMTLSDRLSASAGLGHFFSAQGSLQNPCPFLAWRWAE